MCVCVCLLFLCMSGAECAEPVSILGMTDHETGAATRQRTAVMSTCFREGTTKQRCEFGVSFCEILRSL